MHQRDTVTIMGCFIREISREVSGSPLQRAYMYCMYAFCCRSSRIQSSHVAQRITLRDERCSYNDRLLAHVNMIDVVRSSSR